MSCFAIKNPSHAVERGSELLVVIRIGSRRLIVVSLDFGGTEAPESVAARLLNI